MDTAVEQQGATIRFGWWSVSLWIGLTFLGYLLGVVFHFPGDADPYLFRINGIERSALIAGILAMMFFLSLLVGINSPD
jgi:hypothetical protein